MSKFEDFAWPQDTKNSHIYGHAWVPVEQIYKLHSLKPTLYTLYEPDKNTNRPIYCMGGLSRKVGQAMKILQMNQQMVRTNVTKHGLFARNDRNATMYLRKAIDMGQNKDFCYNMDAQNKQVVELESWLEIKSWKKSKGFIRKQYFNPHTKTVRHPRESTLILRSKVTQMKNNWFTGVNVQNHKVTVNETWVLVQIKGTSKKGFIRKKYLH